MRFTGKYSRENFTLVQEIVTDLNNSLLKMLKDGQKYKRSMMNPRYTDLLKKQFLADRILFNLNERLHEDQLQYDELLIADDSTLKHAREWRDIWINLQRIIA